MTEARLIKIDKNGSKHFVGEVTCDRCGGSGVYACRVENGQIIPHPAYNGVCLKCGGTGKVTAKWIERTAEYQAKLDARRQKREEARRAEWEKKQAEIEAIRKAEAEERAREEARIKAEKAISQYVCEIGQKLNVKCTLDKKAWFEVRSFCGYGTDTMHVYTFKDVNGNKLVWKTSAYVDVERGEPVELTGTVKEHSEYRDEKQTVLTRCKVKAIES